MSTLALQVENLGKRYTLGPRRESYPTLRAALATGLRRLAAPRTPADATLWALRGVTFDVPHGAALGIIGRNGAGKTTLLKLLAHITHPSEGRIALRGRVGSLLEVGTGFHPELTGRDNIYLNGAILGMRRAEIQRKFDEIVAFAEIEKFLDTPVKRYSSGMYVRLAFAVAAHLEPEILLVDEVLAVGDAAFQAKCLGKMGAVAREGRTVLFVSHNLQAVVSLCQRGLLLADGQVSYLGSAAEAVGVYLQNNGSEQVLEQDIEAKPRRPSEGILVRLAHIALAFPSGSRQIWEPLEFRLGYKCLGAPVTCGLSLEVWRQDGTCAFTTDLEDDQQALALQPGDSGTATVLVAHPNLPPDRYVVRAVARSGGRVIDWVDEALVFDVFNREQVSVRVSERHLGSRARGAWTVLPN